MKTTLAALALCVVATTAHAQSPSWAGSGNDAIEGCAMMLNEMPETNVTDGLRAGFCLGVVTAYGRAGSDVGVCEPDGVTNGQGMRVVLQWMRQHPQWLHEQFVNIAIVAMRQTWPCEGQDNDANSRGEPPLQWRKDFPSDVGTPMRVVPR